MEGSWKGHGDHPLMWHSHTTPQQVDAHRGLQKQWQAAIDKWRTLKRYILERKVVSDRGILGGIIIKERTGRISISISGDNDGGI